MQCINFGHLIADKDTKKFALSLTKTVNKNHKVNNITPPRRNSRFLNRHVVTILSEQSKMPPPDSFSSGGM